MIKGKHWLLLGVIKWSSIQEGGNHEQSYLIKQTFTIVLNDAFECKNGDRWMQI